MKHVRRERPIGVRRDSENGMMTVQAELRAPLVTVQIARFVLPQPFNNVMTPVDAYRLDLCVTPRPRNARACFTEKWGPHRFEPIGDMFLVPPGERMHVRADSGRQVSIVCDVQRDHVERWLERDIEWTDRRLEASLNVSCPHVKSLLLRLAEEAHRPRLESMPLAELIAGQLAIELGRFCMSIENAPAAGGLAAWRLRIIDERLADLARPPTLGELAALCNMSVRQLTRGFRASRGCSVTDHVLHFRIEGAKRLLAGEENVKAIGFAMGFASPSSFAYAFRRGTGVTPSDFRQRLLRANLQQPAHPGSDGPNATLRPMLEGETRCQPDVGNSKQATKKKRPGHRPAAGQEGTGSS
jgi:AraC family transcriptional regulator